MQLTITKFHDSKNGTKKWEKDGKSGEYTWYSCGAQFAEHGDKWFNGFIKDFELKRFGVQYPKEMIGKKVEVNLTQEEYNGKMQDKFEIIVPKGEKGGGFTEQDRQMLREIHQFISAKKEVVADEGLKPEDTPF